MNRILKKKMGKVWPKKMKRVWPLIFLPVLCLVLAFVYPEKNQTKELSRATRLVLIQTEKFSLLGMIQKRRWQKNGFTWK
jgi:hypothetical protein